MVKVGGKRNTHKVCKKRVNFFKTEGQFFKVRGNNNFREAGGKCTETGKIGGNSKFVVEKFFGKRSHFLKFSTESENFSKIGGKSETEEKNASWPQGDGRPCIRICLARNFSKP